jgi:hypothetical protein
MSACVALLVGQENVAPFVEEQHTEPGPMFRGLEQSRRPPSGRRSWLNEGDAREQIAESGYRFGDRATGEMTWRSDTTHSANSSK